MPSEAELSTHRMDIYVCGMVCRIACLIEMSEPAGEGAGCCFMRKRTAKSQSLGVGNVILQKVN